MTEVEDVENICSRPHCVRIGVSVITCFRPGGLLRMLEGLAAQEFAKNPKPEIRIVVVDNDANGSARAVCDQFTIKHDINILYGIEETRGISVARDHAVELIKNEVDFIAILDDDEVPERNWLDEFMTAQHEFDADILTGPVACHFVGSPPAWLTGAKFFGSGNLPNGKDLSNNYGHVYTSNLFARASVFQQIRFDERFKLNGAEDTHLFMQVYKKGFKTVWADNALVTEWLPGSRTNAKWLWKRAYRGGNSFAFCELVENRSVLTRVKRFAKGVTRFLQGIGMTLLSFGRKAPFVRGVQKICLGAGMVTGSLGSQYQEYREIHSV